MAAWSKVKQQLESFMSPNLVGRVEYSASSYRYTKDKGGKSHIFVDKKDLFNMNNPKHNMTWYNAANDVIKDPEIDVQVTEEEIAQLREQNQGKIPEDRLAVIIKKRKLAEAADCIYKEQIVMTKSDFADAANDFLTSSIEESLASSNILANIFAIMDRRVGKSRLRKMKPMMSSKHAIVRYFYELRCEVDGVR